MVRFPQIASLNKMVEVAHRRNEPIGECCHVPHAGAACGIGYLLCLRVVHRKRLLAKNMLAVPNGFESNRSMRDIRRGDDHGVDIVACKNIGVVPCHDRCPGLCAGLAEVGFVRIADGYYLRVRAECKRRKVILERDSTATDEGDVQCAARHRTTVRARDGLTQEV